MKYFLKLNYDLERKRQIIPEDIQNIIAEVRAGREELMSPENMA